eukprot:1483590-Pyramimonas_sp.AAC.1
MAADKVACDLSSLRFHRLGSVAATEKVFGLATQQKPEHQKASRLRADLAPNNSDGSAILFESPSFASGPRS